MKSYYAQLGLALVFVSLAFIGVAVKSADAPDLTLRSAPLNPVFLQWLASSPAKSSSNARGSGYVPSPVDRSHMVGLVPNLVTTAVQTKAYPESFDLRAAGKVTSVKDQGTCGDCWSFSTLASVESNILVSGGGGLDFSENHQNVRHGFTMLPCSGANGDVAGAYMTRWRGVDTGNPDSPQAAGLVYEADDPYTGSAAISIPNLYPRVHLQEFLVLPNRSSGTDNDNYKYVLQNYGAIDIGIYIDSGILNDLNSSYWNQSNSAYYYYGPNPDNHEVAIVGWNDNYPAANFSTRPPGDGAFIVKNQWGNKWGDGGFFYVSYYDSQLNDAHVFRPPASNLNYAHSYFYDPFGMTSSTGYSSNTGWGANVFTTDTSEKLQAIAFYTATLNTSYEVYIYTNVTGDPATGILESGTLNTSGTIAFAGYHTVVLARPVNLAAGQRFAVVVKFVTPGYFTPVPVELSMPGYDESATASSSQSYISADGLNWQDLTTVFANGNITIRAFTSTALAPPGDANNDGVVDVKDLDYIASQILGINQALGNPDCNVDKAINSLDLVCVVNIATKIP